LKNALVRRIKMLEYALKQERLFRSHFRSHSFICLKFRLKFNKLKYGSETAPLENQKTSPNEGPPIFDDGKKSCF